MAISYRCIRICRAHTRQRLFCRIGTTRSFKTSQAQLAGDVRIVEVGPRDGLQNEPRTIDLASKLELIRRLANTGIRTMEAGSFVAPNRVPQMASSTDVLNELLGHPPLSRAPIAYNFLIPNHRGLQNFLAVSASAASSSSDPPDPSAPETSPQNPNDVEPSRPSERDKGSVEEPSPITSSQDPDEMPSDTSGIDNPIQPGKVSSAGSSQPSTFEISLFTAATEAFSQANTNCSIAESLKRCQPIADLAKTHDLRVRGYVSVALGCPFEGPSTSASKVAEITTALLEMGVDEVSIADTTGMGTAPKTAELLQTLFAAGISPHDLALHFHDTYGQALVNVVVGLEKGIRTFDSSIAGLGGCPFAKGATGNIATEDLIHCLHSLGAKTDVDLEEVSRIGAWISNELGRPNESRAGKAILARLVS